MAGQRDVTAVMGMRLGHVTNVMFSPQIWDFIVDIRQERYCVNYKRLGERESGNDAAHITQYHKISGLSPLSLIRILSDLEIQLFPRHHRPRPALTIVIQQAVANQTPPAPNIFPHPNMHPSRPHIGANIYIKLICIHSHNNRAIYNGRS